MLPVPGTFLSAQKTLIEKHGRAVIKTKLHAWKIHYSVSTSALKYNSNCLHNNSRPGELASNNGIRKHFLENSGTVRHNADWSFFYKD